MLSQITNNFQILARTENGELSFLGRTVSNSSFDALMESAFKPNSNNNITKIEEFLKGLRLIHVNSAELSATSFKTVYKPTSPQYHPPSKNVHRLPTELQESKVPSSPSILRARVKH